MNKLIIKLNTSNSLQVSPEGVKINKLISSISPLNFIKLLHHADNKVNPRIANVNRITKSIHETLETSPDLLWLKSKGILLATESCKLLDRNRIEISLDNLDYEGIMDGGHNTFAIAIFIIKELFGVSIKKWEDCKNYWDNNYEEILEEFKKNEERFQFSIPIEIISPNEEDGSLEYFYDCVSEICSARNNNVQLNEAAKGNQVGKYEYLKELLKSDFEVIWKTGDQGKIKAEDVISLACLPLITLQANGLLPKDLKGLNKISLYSQKSKCVDFFNEVLEHPEVSERENGKYVLTNKYVASALNLTEDILKFFDRMYLEFPDLYHNASPGKFGRISSVDNKSQSRVPFYTTDTFCNYKYPFGFFYPIIGGLTGLMYVDSDSQTVGWKVNPMELDLSDLGFTQYVNIIKLVNFDPQKVGKGEVFYKEAESVFDKVEAI